MSKEFQELLDHPDKQTGRATGELARLWRKILADLRVGNLEFDRLLLAYFNDPANAVLKTGRMLASERGNLMKEFGREDITWKVFLKGLKFLRPRSIKISITLTWNDPRNPEGRQTVHELHCTDEK